MALWSILTFLAVLIVAWLASTMGVVTCMRGVLTMTLQCLLQAYPGFDTFTFNLFKNDVSPNPALPGSQFEKLTLGAYAGDVTFAWDQVGFDSNGYARAVEWNIPVNIGTATTSLNAYGWWVKLESADDVGWIAERFNEPISLGDGSSISVAPELANLGVGGTAQVNT